MRAEQTKQSKEESVQKMRTALKDKEKAEKVLRGVMAKAETLADAQFTIDRIRERVRELETEADANEVAMTKLHLQIVSMADEMRCTSAEVTAFRKQRGAMFLDRAWFYAGQVSYGIAARRSGRGRDQATRTRWMRILAAHVLDEESAKVLMPRQAGY